MLFELYGPDVIVIIVIEIKPQYINIYVWYHLKDLFEQHFVVK